MEREPLIETANRVLYSYDLQVRGEAMGRDFLLRVTGGDVHIGAAAMAFPMAHGIQTQVLSVPGHRESELAVELAAQASEILGCTVTVVAGIHVDGASKELITRLVERTRELAAAEIRMWQKAQREGRFPQGSWV